METEYLIRAVLSLIFVVALIGIVAVIFQKFAIEKRFTNKDSSKKLRIIEYQMIDSKRRLAVVGFGKKEIVILLGPNGETVINKDQMHVAEKPAVKKVGKETGFKTVAKD